MYSALLSRQGYDFKQFHKYQANISYSVVIPAKAGIQRALELWRNHFNFISLYCHSRESGNPALPKNLVQILPTWIVFFDEFHFPTPLPLLELFFSLQGRLYIRSGFIINQMMNLIFICETFYLILFVFINPSLEVIRHSDIQSPVSFVGKDINVISLHWFLLWIPTFAGMTI